MEALERKIRALKGPIALALDDRVAVAGYADGTIAVADLLDAAPSDEDARAHAAVSFQAKNMWDYDDVPSLAPYEQDADDGEAPRGDQCAVC